MSTLKILGVGGHSIAAVCRFEYRGLTISASTVFPHASDRVLVEGTDGKELFTCYKVEDAITEIDVRLSLNNPVELS